MTSKPHALYRFFNADGDLLYVGITLDPGSRWKQHRDDKPWWSEIATVSVETHADRAAVLQAERAAIIEEKPRYNVVHNRGNGGLAPDRAVPQLDRIAPIQPGDWVALGLRDGRCPVGEVVAQDETWISLRLKDFMDGCISSHATAIRWDEVARVEIAYPEDSFEDKGWGRRMDDEHLGDFQSAWQRANLPPDDPFKTALTEVRRERALMRDGRR